MDPDTQTPCICLYQGIAHNFFQQFQCFKCHSEICSWYSCKVIVMDLILFFYIWTSRFLSAIWRCYLSSGMYFWHLCQYQRAVITCFHTQVSYCGPLIYTPITIFCFSFFFLNCISVIRLKIWNSNPTSIIIHIQITLTQFWGPLWFWDSVWIWGVFFPISVIDVIRIFTESASNL